MDKKQLSENEIVYERFIVNLDVELIKQIEEHVFNLKIKGVKMFDLKTNKEKTANKSLWSRQVYLDALNSKKVSDSVNIEKLNKLEEKYGVKEIGRLLDVLDSMYPILSK